MIKSKFVALAAKISQKSPSKFKVGCIITRRNRVVATGYNNMGKTHPKSITYENYLHAETHALMNLPLSLTQGTTVYVYRGWRNGKMADSKPCPFCELNLRRAKVKRVYYSTITGIVKEEVY